MLYAYNPPGVGEEAAGVKAQVCACEALHYGYRQIVETQQAPRSCRRGLLWYNPYIWALQFLYPVFSAIREPQCPVKRCVLLCISASLLQIVCGSAALPRRHNYERHKLSLS